jgi:hypothetical protein
MIGANLTHYTDSGEASQFELCVAMIENYEKLRLGNQLKYL